MEKKKKKASIFSAVALAVMVSVVAGLFMQRSGLTPSYLVFASDSNPDGYGNMIYAVDIWQNKTGNFEEITGIVYTTYTEGQTVEIDANYPTKLLARVFINKTLCGNNIDLADDYTRVYWNISTVCTDFVGIYKETGSAGDFYEVFYWSKTWTPATDIEYSVSIHYEAYY